MTKIFSAVQTARGFKAQVSVKPDFQRESVIWVSSFSFRTTAEAIAAASQYAASQYSANNF